jgi:hypothetical protein
MLEVVPVGLRRARRLGGADRAGRLQWPRPRLPVEAEPEEREAAGPDGGPPRVQAPGRALGGRSRGARKREGEVVMGLGQDPDVGVLAEETFEAGGVFGDAGGGLDVPAGEAEGHRGSVPARAACSRTSRRGSGLSPCPGSAVAPRATPRAGGRRPHRGAPDHRAVVRGGGRHPEDRPNRLGHRDPTFRLRAQLEPRVPLFLSRRHLHPRCRRPPLFPPRGAPHRGHRAPRPPHRGGVRGSFLLSVQPLMRGTCYDGRMHFELHTPRQIAQEEMALPEAWSPPNVSIPSRRKGPRHFPILLLLTASVTAHRTQMPHRQVEDILKFDFSTKNGGSTFAPDIFASPVGRLHATFGSSAATPAARVG